MVYKIKLAKSSFLGNGIRVVEIYPYGEDSKFCLTINELLEILRLWIIGEEIKFPMKNGFKGRWMLYEEITKLFNKEDLIQEGDL